MQATERQLQQLVRKHAKTLHLWNWSFGRGAGQPSMTNAADCEANPEYFSAELRFRTDRIKADEAEAFVIHELLHCYTEGLARVATTLAGKDERLLEWIRNEEERLTTALEHIIVALLATIERLNGSAQAERRARKSSTVRRPRPAKRE